MVGGAASTELETIFPGDEGQSALAFALTSPLMPMKETIAPATTNMNGKIREKKNFIADRTCKSG